MEWFRMYSEFASDAKVQSMSEAMQRRLMMLLCLRCSNALVTLQDDEIAFALRISEDELAETKAIFLKKGFVDESWEIMNWDKRQFISDSSAARVAKHRAAKKEGRQHDQKEANQDCNVTVTPQNRTDTEQIQKEPLKNKPKRDPSGFAAFWTAYPRKVKKPAAEKAFNKIDIALLDKILTSIAGFKKSSEWLEENGKYIPHPATWLNDKRWEDEVSQSTAYRPIIPIIKPPDEPRNYKPEGIAPLKSLLKIREPA